MLKDKDEDTVAVEVTDQLELDEFVEQRGRTHHDRYARHTHDLPDDSSEASSRALVRVVPLAYGALLGGLADSLWLGFAAGLVLSMAFDLNMAENSLVRSLSRGLVNRLCPTVTRAAHRLARLIRRLGLVVPSTLSAMRCRLSRP